MGATARKQFESMIRLKIPSWTPTTRHEIEGREDKLAASGWDTLLSVLEDEVHGEVALDGDIGCRGCYIFVPGFAGCHC